MADNYEQQRAISQSMQDARERIERESIIEKLDEILSLLRKPAPVKEKKE